MISLTLNGRPTECTPDLAKPLLTVLRDELGLTGAKHACGLEQCGACLVLVDGSPRPSCRTPVGELAGREIRTIEGLAEDETFLRVRGAFMDEEAFQCGMCTPGFIVAAVALLIRDPDPSDENIRRGLDRNLCRCGAYPRIFRAVRRAAGRPVDRPAVTVLDAPLPAQHEKPPALPASFERSPDLDQWLRVDTDGGITLFAGKVEYGQGILTALAQVAAEELDVDFRRMRVVPAATGLTPDEGMTVGSMSLMTTGNAVRIAAAEARAALLALALEELEADPAQLRVEDGTITDAATGRSVTYWDLLGGRLFERAVTGHAPQKNPDDYSLLGKAAPRLDAAQKTSGAPVFLHDFQPEGLRYARVLRPPKPDAELLFLDTHAAAAVPGVESVYREASFAAVIARDPHAAAQGHAALSDGAAWNPGPPLAGGADHTAHLKSRPAESFHIVDGAPVEGPIPDALVRAPVEETGSDGLVRPAADGPDKSALTGLPQPKTIRAAYSRPFQMHASIAPSAATAQYDGERLTLWAHSQGVYPLRRYIAHALDLPEDRIHVVHLEGPGCYGHNGADDAAFDAALLAVKHPGAPIRVAWSRADEHRWEPYTPAMAIELAADLDDQGRITAWDHQVWSYPHLGRSADGGEISGLLGTWYQADPKQQPVPRPSTWSHSGGYRNADPLYVLPNKRVVKHFVRDRPLRTSSMRGLGAFANVFAIESFMDELAHAAGADPLAFRLDYLQDPRARDVLQAAAELAGWTPASRPRADGAGRGLAFARYKNSAAYCAVVVDVEVDAEQIALKRAFIAADAGQLVNPDGLANQLEGGLVQAASWTLKEAVKYGPDGIASIDWETYPILRFGESPEIRTVLLNRPGAPFLGSGEASSGPAGAAIANAVFDATGRRLRQLPLTL